MKSMALVPMKKSSPLSLLKIVSEKIFQMKEKYSSFMKDIILEEKCSSFIHILKSIPSREEKYVVSLGKYWIFNKDNKNVGRSEKGTDHDGYQNVGQKPSTNCFDKKFSRGRVVGDMFWFD